MKHFEINLKISDIQILGGLTYTVSKELMKKIKRHRKLKDYEWLSLETFCLYLNVKYHHAFTLLDNRYKTGGK